MDEAVHTQIRSANNKSFDETPQVYVKTVSKHVLVPQEETVRVPVVRKEKVNNPKKAIAKGQKMVLTRKCKEVEETVLEVHQVMVDGHMEKRAVPVTRMKKIYFNDYEPEEVDVVVSVPFEEVVTRTGYRTDKHMVNKVKVVEEDHIFEMRPVYMGKGETRVKDREDHHTYLTSHGTPTWSDQAHPGWTGRPTTPPFRPDLKCFERPTTADTIQSSRAGDNPGATSNMRPRRNSSGPVKTRPGSYTRPRPGSARSYRGPAPPQRPRSDSYVRPGSATKARAEARTPPGPTVRYGVLA
jgi:hypothetical protein